MSKSKRGFDKKDENLLDFLNGGKDEEKDDEEEEEDLALEPDPDLLEEE